MSKCKFSGAKYHPRVCVLGGVSEYEYIIDGIFFKNGMDSKGCAFYAGFFRGVARFLLQCKPF